MKLLLVDDNEVDMKEFRDLLEINEHEVVHVHNTQELKDVLAKSSKFDGIILDLMFPLEDDIPDEESEYGYRIGLLLYNRYLKETYPDVPFVILTAMDHKIQIHLQILKNLVQFDSFKGIFQKPVDLNELIKALSNID